MGMPHDLNSTPSYEHLMGTPKRAHLGSQSSSPAPEKDPGGYTESKVGKSRKGKSLPEKASNGMSYSDE
jgi:hypothetical protein